MSCFTDLKWPYCQADDARGIHECSEAVHDRTINCCLSDQTPDKLHSNCPMGWRSNPANAEWCTDDWNAFGAEKYRHKCERIVCANPDMDPNTNCATPAPAPAANTCSDCSIGHVGPAAEHRDASKNCACESGYTDCCGFCRDTTRDRENCGACNTECTGDHAMCCGEGTCTENSVANCGACGTQCAGAQICGYDLTQDVFNCHCAASGFTADCASCLPGFDQVAGGKCVSPKTTTCVIAVGTEMVQLSTKSYDLTPRDVIVKSLDGGATWRTVLAGKRMIPQKWSNLTSVVYTGTAWLANASVYSQDDGETWTYLDYSKHPEAAPSYPSGIAVGEDGSGNLLIVMNSEDGLKYATRDTLDANGIIPWTWTTGEFSNTFFSGMRGRDIAYAANVWVAVFTVTLTGQEQSIIAYSTDGYTWARAVLDDEGKSGYLTKVSFRPDLQQWLAVGLTFGGKLYQASAPLNARNWSASSSPAVSDNNINAIACDGTDCFVAGTFNMTEVDKSGSARVLDWTNGDQAFYGNGIVYTGNDFIAVGKPKPLSQNPHPASIAVWTTFGWEAVPNINKNFELYAVAVRRAIYAQFI